MGRRYFEDFRVGEVIELGSRSLSEESIIAFAREYDPQPFHTDPEAAKHSVFGGLVASGWQTASVYMRLLVDGMVDKVAHSMGSPGVDKIEWLKPVRPGDTLRGRLTIVDAIPSKSRADRGTLKTLGELINQDGDVVMTIRGVGFFGRRPA
ncbi:MAG TPA: MaoC family dehydratase [Stellaceae bacterium]|nr:MaoC family dehydratase [Stellaceae bacterium]